MIVRCAYLEGSVSPEHRARFDQFVITEIVPLMKQFPGATSVRMLRAETIEDGGPSLYMTFETIYPSVQIMKDAFAQPIRRVLREKLNEILPLFDGRIFHVTQTLLTDETLTAS